MVRKVFVETPHGLVARVTFILPNSLWADRVYLVGDFNGWNPTSHPLQRDRAGRWTITVDLEVGRAYEFRYLRDGQEWMNECHADAFVCNPFGGDNFVILTDPPSTSETLPERSAA